MEIWRLGTEVPRVATRVSDTMCTVHGINLLILEDAIPTELPQLAKDSGVMKLIL
jgi:hypothetical protein